MRHDFLLIMLKTTDGCHGNGIAGISLLEERQPGSETIEQCRTLARAKSPTYTD